MYHSSRVGACKHLYGLIEHLKRMQTSHSLYTVPVFSLPSSRDDATKLYEKHISSIPPSLQPQSATLTAISALYDMVEQLDENLLLESQDPVNSDESSTCLTADPVSTTAVLLSSPSFAAQGESLNQAVSKIAAKFSGLR